MARFYAEDTKNDRRNQWGQTSKGLMDIRRCKKTGAVATTREAPPKGSATSLHPSDTDSVLQSVYAAKPSMGTVPKALRRGEFRVAHYLSRACRRRLLRHDLPALRGIRRLQRDKGRGQGNRQRYRHDTFLFRKVLLRIRCLDQGVRRKRAEVARFRQDVTGQTTARNGLPRGKRF